MESKLIDENFFILQYFLLFKTIWLYFDHISFLLQVLPYPLHIFYSLIFKFFHRKVNKNLVQ